jgi:hypothetical protein
MLACGQDSAGVPLVCVVDQTNRRLAVMPAPPDGAALIGKEVAVHRDPNGRLVLRRDGLERGM